MNVYFDFSNFLSLIHSAKDIRYHDCMRMIRDNFTIKFTFNKDAIEKASADDRSDIMQWFTNMAYGKGDVNWDSAFPQCPVKMDDIRKRPYNYSVYCLDETKRSDLDNLINRGIVIVGKTGSELNTLSGLLVYSNQYAKNVFDDIVNWDSIKKYASPCSDIIIVDQFILSSPELYEYNLYKLVKCLAENSKNEKVNIVIVTLKEIYDKKTKRTFIPDWDKIYTELRARVNKKFRPNITFVTATGDNLEHDRTIFTNYKTFASGDTYNYFDSNGAKITDGRWLHVHSLADGDNMKDAIDLLNDIQKLIDDTLKLNDSNIKKDRVCNFLKFYKE